MAEWNNFKGAAKRLEDADLPRIARTIGVGEDELHAFMDVEAAGSGFDAQGRPKMLFEPHVFYRNLRGAARDRAVAAGLAYAKWGAKPYPKDSYPRLAQALAIDEEAALMSASWGLTQILGENYAMVGFDSVADMVRAFMADEDNHLEAAVAFIVAAGIDDELRALARLTRPTTPADCVPIVLVYNGKGYKKNKYHEKFAKAHNRWRGIKDTPWGPEEEAAAPVPSLPTDEATVKKVQQLLREKGYYAVGPDDGDAAALTQAAILAFRNEHGLPLTPEIDAELLEALVAAPKRYVPPERAGASEAEIMQKKDTPVAEPVRQSFIQKVAAGLAAAGSGGYALVEGVLGNLGGATDRLAPLKSILGGIPAWVYGLLICGVAVVIWLSARKVGRDAAEMYRKGQVA
jgi:hypothetical protein